MRIKQSSKKNILVVGSGRWAGEIVKELLKFLNPQRIFILQSQKHSIQFKNKFKINFLFSLKNLKKKQISHAVICNKTQDHYKFFNQIKNYRVKILIEKPLTDNSRHNNLIYKFARNQKNSFFISSQFYFSNFFWKVKKILSTKNIQVSKINIVWHDKKNEYRKGIKKKHNFKIRYIIDSFYHIYSIINVILSGKNKKILKDFSKKNGLQEFFYKKIKFVISVSRNKKKRIRIINIFSKDKIKLLKIDFSSSKPIIRYKKKIIYDKKDECLVEQLKSFVLSKRNLSRISLEKNGELLQNLKKIN